jgi:flagellar biosynthetic protein FliR
MELRFDFLWLTAVFLVAIRLGPLFVLAPVFGTADIPVRMRVLLTVAFSLALVSATGTRAFDVGNSLGGLLSAAVSELFVGIAFTFGVLAAFAAFLYGGRLLDYQTGFGVANLFDPVTRSQGPLLGTALNLLAIAVFFAVDGHHALVRGIGESLALFPPGRPLSELHVTAIVEQFGLVFSYGVLIVAPSVIVMLLLDVGLSIAARTMPQMNIFIVAMPLKVFVGLLTLALSLRTMPLALRRVFDSMPHYWQRLFA